MADDLRFAFFYSCRSQAKNNIGLKYSMNKKRCIELLKTYLNQKLVVAPSCPVEVYEHIQCTL